MFAQEKLDSEARRDFFGVALLGLTGGTLAAMLLGPAQAAEKTSAAKLEGSSPRTRRRSPPATRPASLLTGSVWFSSPVRAPRT